MSKHIEAEGGELLIETSNGYKAIIPKNMAAWVKEHIKSGNHAAVDHYVKGLKELKPGKKAQDGMKIKPAASDATRVASEIPNVLYPREDLIRPDGTMKDVGFLGVQKSPRGFDITEYSIGVPLNGKIIDAPTLVPGLSQEEVKYVVDKADRREDLGRDKMGNAIYKKAAQNARQRAMMGMSPFYSSALESEKLYAVPSVSTSVAPVVERKMIGKK
jgi:hypothetical protein